MTIQESYLTLRLATTERDLMAAQRLRYRIFIEELGAEGGDLVDHDLRLEKDRYDPFCDHLLLIDKRRDPSLLEDVVGVYRLLSMEGARKAGGFYSAGEYDLGPLIRSRRSLLELGRSCVMPDLRGGPAMMLLWNGLADYILSRRIEILFGTASFPGLDVRKLALPLSFLHHTHLAPPELRVAAHGGGRQRMDLIAAEAVDSRAAMRAIPPLIRAYLRMGGCVGDGAWVDRTFNTTDVCLVMDTTKMSDRHRNFYSRKVMQHEHAGT
ncbi:GNAT family N-acetyltransferase [Falsirhodobacter sp. alg1]|uniref:GNAT family N-acetyltransferase n=1 Tax=Falsirhodobacter sp. alg1 TaxID=1472418 RepID=UPI0005F0371B|nr:GNAT family N-acyltransferase [Falsirhodobacter sp. alg1]